MTRLDWWTSWAAAAALSLLGLAAPAASPSPRYEVTAVDGKLVRVSAGGEERLAPGASLAGGDELATGWFSSAELTATPAAARFRLLARTRVRLAVERPGLLLVLEKGRLRALFDRLTGGEGQERRVETPSAVLAVRGTEYGLAVGRNGATTLAVFEGVVEVSGPGLPGPGVTVRSGEALHVRPGEPPGTPYPHGLSRRGWDRGEMPALGAGPGDGPRGRTGPPPGPRERPQGPPPAPPPP